MIIYTYEDKYVPPLSLPLPIPHILEAVCTLSVCQKSQLPNPRALLIHSLLDAGLLGHSFQAFPGLST